ncbi:MAG: metallophosphoesterase family protein [Prochlorotrichaceae cyanobacterium]
MPAIDLNFAIIGDPHVGLPHTIKDHPYRFHLIEVSIPALEQILTHLAGLDLDFVLLPGDLTQHGERENHRWLADRLRKLPCPAYVVPGNHDVPYLHGDVDRIGIDEFPAYYQGLGYSQNSPLYYSQPLAPGVRLVGMNSNTFDGTGKQLGYVHPEQIDWLATELDRYRDDLILLMIHHNLIEHLPDQSTHPLGQRYMLSNAQTLLQKLTPQQVPLIVTGHLHVQDVAQWQGFCEVTTGSLVSYPHPYRICRFQQTPEGQRSLKIQSPRVRSVPGWEDLQHQSREWMGNHSERFMLRLLTQPPLCFSDHAARPFLSQLRYLWANVADGDRQFQFPDFPAPVRQYLERFSAVDGEGNPTTIDNEAEISLCS